MERLRLNYMNKKQLMVKIYVSLIKKKLKTINDMPEKIRAEVQAELDK